MAAVVDEALLSEIKNFLDITWEDAAGDEKLSGIIFRGMKRINELCGTEFDYSAGSEDAAAKDLLINYVMYARADALNDFMDNYGAEINRLQLIQEAKAYAEKETEQGTV